MTISKFGFIILIFSILFILNPVYSEYLGNLEFDIQDDGIAIISGNTDYSEFNITQTDKLTSKNKENWLFELNTPIFEKYYYSIILPKDAQINYINSPNSVRITSTNKRINIISTGSNQNIQIKIQYRIIQNDDLNSYFLEGIISGIVIVFLIIILSFFKYKKKKKELKSKKTNNIFLDELNDRQKKIIDILKSTKNVTQNYLLKELKIPKSSLSRNLKSLKAKDLIEIKRFGMTNKIELKEQKN